MSRAKQKIYLPDKILIIIIRGKTSNEVQSRMSKLTSQGIEYEVKAITSEQLIHRSVHELVTKVNNGGELSYVFFYILWAMVSKRNCIALANLEIVLIWC